MAEKSAEISPLQAKLFLDANAEKARIERDVMIIAQTLLAGAGVDVIPGQPVNLRVETDPPRIVWTIPEAPKLGLEKPVEA